MNDDDEIKISAIKRISVNPGEVLLFELEVGRMPPEKVKEYIALARDRLREAFPDGVKFIVATMRNGKPDLKITAISPEIIR